MEKAMANSVIALPVSVEQVAVAIRQMKLADRKRLMELVPELRQETTEVLPRTLEQARASVESLRVEVQQALAGTSLSPDEPFLDNLTIGQYLDLPDDKRAQLWDEWAVAALDEIDEREVTA
jgi:hypothetical protein